VLRTDVRCTRADVVRNFGITSPEGDKNPLQLLNEQGFFAEVAAVACYDSIPFLL